MTAPVPKMKPTRTTNIVTRTDLSKRTKFIMNKLETSRRIIVTNHGRAEAVIQRIDPEQVLALVVDNVDELIEARRDAEIALDEGNVVTSEELFAE